MTDNEARAAESGPPADAAPVGVSDSPAPEAADSKAKTGGCCGSFMSSMICCDMFGKKAELTLPSGKTSYKTLSGCICSLLVIGVVVLFAAAMVRDSVLDERPKYLLEWIEREYFSPQDVFDGKKMGFTVAFGTAEPGQTE